MSEISSRNEVEKKYGESSRLIEYLGVHNSQHCYGVINKDVVITIDLPFYVLVDDSGEITEIEMPVIADDEYFSSQFNTIEEKFKFYDKYGVLL